MQNDINRQLQTKSYIPPRICIGMENLGDLTEKDIREFSLLRQKAELQKAYDKAWDKWYAIYKNTAEYKEYSDLKAQHEAICKVIDRLKEETIE